MGNSCNTGSRTKYSQCAHFSESMGYPNLICLRYFSTRFDTLHRLDDSKAPTRGAPTTISVPAGEIALPRRGRSCADPGSLGQIECTHPPVYSLSCIRLLGTKPRF